MVIGVFSPGGTGCTNVDAVSHTKECFSDWIQQPTLRPLLCLACGKAPGSVSMWVAHSCPGGLVPKDEVPARLAASVGISSMPDCIIKNKRACSNEHTQNYIDRHSSTATAVMSMKAQYMIDETHCQVRLSLVVRVAWRYEVNPRPVLAPRNLGSALSSGRALAADVSQARLWLALVQLSRQMDTQTSWPHASEETSVPLVGVCLYALHRMVSNEISAFMI